MSTGDDAMSSNGGPGIKYELHSPMQQAHLALAELQETIEGLLLAITPAQYEQITAAVKKASDAINSICLIDEPAKLYQAHD